MHTGILYIAYKYCIFFSTCFIHSVCAMVRVCTWVRKEACNGCSLRLVGKVHTYINYTYAYKYYTFQPALFATSAQWCASAQGCAYTWV